MRLVRQIRPPALVGRGCGIGDVIDATDINIYRELGGGVTTANILHGSANTIGGQNQVIKSCPTAP